jgi:hypothetical protein
MYRGKALSGGGTNNRRTGRGDRDRQVVVRTLLSPRKSREQQVADVTIVAATVTHNDKQEYAEDGDHDHENEDDHDNGTLKFVNMCSICLMRGCLPRPNERDRCMDKQQSDKSFSLESRE